MKRVKIIALKRVRIIKKKGIGLGVKIIVSVIAMKRVSTPLI
jgi:hypothetical protein